MYSYETYYRIYMQFSMVTVRNIFKPVEIKSGLYEVAS